MRVGLGFAEVIVLRSRVDFDHTDSALFKCNKKKYEELYPWFKRSNDREKKKAHSLSNCN